MKLMIKILSLCIVFWLAGCVQYTLVKTGAQKVGKIQLNVAEPWNKSPHKMGPKVTTWTSDGMFLNKLIFVDGVAQGEKLMKETSKDTPLPKFKSDLLPHEIEDYIKSSLINNAGGQLTIETANLKPSKFGDAMGVEFELSFYNADGLAYRGKAMSAIKNQKLYAIIYLATKIHYYEKHEKQVEDMLASAVIL